MNLIDIWIGLLGLIVILYVILDGFSLGVALLFPFMGTDGERDVLVHSIAPVWDANQTWLVFGGGALFVAFPMMYSALLSALYIPLFTLLYGLIFRGVSLEFRANTERKGAWDRAFFLGSLAAVAAQGLALGGILSGIQLSKGNFAGGSFDWLTPFSAAIALGLMAGYILLGSTYLIAKTSGHVQDHAYEQAFWAAFVVLFFQIMLIVWTPFHYRQVLYNWLTPPRVYFIWLFPLFSLLSFYAIIRGIRSRKEKMPFVSSAVFFLSGYLALFASIYPYAIPPHVTFYDAAAQQETLWFTLWGAAGILPVVLAYTIYSYRVFRGKVDTKGNY